MKLAKKVSSLIEIVGGKAPTKKEWSRITGIPLKDPDKGEEKLGTKSKVKKPRY